MSVDTKELRDCADEIDELRKEIEITKARLDKAFSDISALQWRNEELRGIRDQLQMALKHADETSARLESAEAALRLWKVVKVHGWELAAIPADHFARYGAREKEKA
jgi:chromosome segregation ATPase